MSSNAAVSRGPMTASDWKIKILQLADRRELPDFITDDEIAPRRYFRELFDAKWITALECPCDGEPDNFQHVRISQQGLDGLQALLDKRQSATPVAVVKRTGVKTFIVIAFLLAMAASAVALLDWWFKVKT